MKRLAFALLSTVAIALTAAVGIGGATVGVADAPTAHATIPTMLSSLIEDKRFIDRLNDLAQRLSGLGDKAV